MRELTQPETAARNTAAEFLTRGLGFEATHQRGLDSLDFKDCGVVGVMTALKVAWTDGFGTRSEPLLDALRAFVEWNDLDQGEGKLEDALHIARGLLARSEG